jgi:hypothetical protein
MRAQFAMVEMDYKHNIIFIEDIANHTGGCTITNDAEAVFKHIDVTYSHASPTPMFWRVVYKDTDNEWWEIVPTYVHDMGGPEMTMSFEKWHGHEWDALKGKIV